MNPSPPPSQRKMMTQKKPNTIKLALLTGLSVMVFVSAACFVTKLGQKKQQDEEERKSAFVFFRDVIANIGTRTLKHDELLKRMDEKNRKRLQEALDEATMRPPTVIGIEYIGRRFIADPTFLKSLSDTHVVKAMKDMQYDPNDPHHRHLANGGISVWIQSIEWKSDHEVVLFRVYGAEGIEYRMVKKNNEWKISSKTIKFLI